MSLQTAFQLASRFSRTWVRSRATDAAEYQGFSILGALASMSAATCGNAHMLVDVFVNVDVVDVVDDDVSRDTCEGGIVEKRVLRAARVTVLDT